MRKIWLALSLALIAFCSLQLALLPVAHANGPGSIAQVGVGSAGQTSNSITSTAAQVIAANSSRAYLYIQNTGANAATIKFGATFSGSEGISIPANGVYAPNPAPTNSIWAKSASGTTLNVVEGNY